MRRCWLKALLVYELVLNQNECLHRVLQCEFVFVHLRENRTNIEMDVAWIGDLQTVVHRGTAKVQVVVLYLKCLLKEGQRRTQFLCTPKHARKVIVCNCTIPVALVCVRFGLLQQLECYRVVL